MPSETINNHSREGGEWTDGPAGYCSNSPPVYGWIRTGDPVYNFPFTLRTFNQRQRSWGHLTNYEARLLAGEVLPTLSYTDYRYIRSFPMLRWQNEVGCVATPYDMHALDSGRGRGWLGTATLTARQISCDADLLAEARLKCLARVKDMQVNLPVLFAEGGQVVSMLRSSFERIGNFAVHLQRGNWRRAVTYLSTNERYRRPTSKGFANQVLEYKYGWIPLLSDCYGSAKALCDSLGGRPPRGRFSASATRDSSSSWSSGVVTAVLLRTNASGSSVTTEKSTGRTGTYQVSAFKKQTARAGLTVSPQFNQMPTSVGLQDPLLLVWEKIPFSFVFDWGIDVSSYLNAITALRGFDVLNGYVSSSIVQEASADATFRPRTTGSASFDGPYLEARRDYSRSSWSGSLPSFGQLVRPLESFGISQLISSLALARQRF